MSVVSSTRSSSSAHFYLRRYGIAAVLFSLVLLIIVTLTDEQAIFDRFLDINFSSFFLIVAFAVPITLIPLALLIGVMRDTILNQKNAWMREVADGEHAVCEAQSKLNREIAEHQEIARQLQIKVTALEIAANAVMIMDWHWRIGWVNKAFCELTGYGPEEVFGQPFSLLRSDINDESFYSNIITEIGRAHV